MITPEQIQRARDTDLIQRLGLRGGRPKICCPFHGERTPSLVIYPAGKGYHCFGCGRHGNNAIDFLMEAGATFTEAVEELTHI